ncbi:MAG TPA: response regulator [Albitalea sp.]|uniref:response regulator n=1 Tax=Piscinibacter sp. TaxID=1903157 RepID=UPI002ED6BB05
MTPIKIMLIDDEPNVLSALQRMLRQRPPVAGRPCAVEAYTSPRAAIEAARERVVDVIVCDYRMPELDGVETLRRLRQMHPQTARILLSGSREFDTVVDAINVAQVGRIVVKPWSDDELVEAIADAVETRRLRLENAELADEVRLQRGLLSRQDAELKRIEGLWPGITRVEWAEDGSVQMGGDDLLGSRFGKLP